MKIYVASSWRNPKQPAVVERLREAGHEVYDFRNPAPGNEGFHWSEIDPAWKGWTPEQFIAGLRHPIARRVFAADYGALAWCDSLVMVQPCGVSSALELGWACGAGKLTVALIDSGEPELVLSMADLITESLDEVLAFLAAADGGEV